MKRFFLDAWQWLALWPVRKDRFLAALHTPQEEALHKAMDLLTLTGTGGDYLEFGSYRGDSLIAAIRIARRAMLRPMRFFAFDSFEGLPEVTAEERQGTGTLEKGMFHCDYASFMARLGRWGALSAKPVVVKGWYADTLIAETRRRHHMAAAALVLIDCDLYSSTVFVLEFITALVQEGTILIFDDWFLYGGDPEKGEERAFREWLEKNPDITATEFLSAGWHLKAFILHRKKRAA